MSAIAAASLTRISELNSQGIGNTVWAVALLNYADDPLRQALAAEAIRKISDTTPQEMANIAWAYSRCEFSHLPLFAATSA